MEQVLADPASPRTRDLNGTVSRQVGEAIAAAVVRATDVR